MVKPSHIIGLILYAVQIVASFEYRYNIDSDIVNSRYRRSSFPGWSQDTSKTSLTEAERVAILLRHNALRSQVSPSATNMKFLVWNDTLAGVAQAYSAICDFDHNYANDYGENLSAQPMYYNVTVMVDNWYLEGDDYDYSSHTCTTSTCAHYHQVVLDESREMGCGLTFCPSMTTVSMSNAYFLVCNYSPAVNKGSSRPYESGASCSNCPAEYPLCENSLCRSDPICDGLACMQISQFRGDICICDCEGESPATCGEAVPGTATDSPQQNNTAEPETTTDLSQQNNTGLQSTGPPEGENAGERSVGARSTLAAIGSLITMFITTLMTEMRREL